MSTTIAMIFAALLAGDEHAPAVRAKVLFGAPTGHERTAEMEPWIHRALSRAGSPSALPDTMWGELDGETRRIYESPRGGIIIDAKATERNGEFTIEVDGCDGGPLHTIVKLRPGERRVARLSDGLEPHNIFVAIEAPVSERTQTAARVMRTHAKTFRLELNYTGQQDKPFYRLLVGTGAADDDRRDPFHRVVQVLEVQAKTIIDCLARDGFFDRAMDLSTIAKVPPPTTPGYTMKVSAGDIIWQEDLGWNLDMLDRLDDLSVCLPESGRHDMALLLGRLSGWRSQWLAERPPLELAAARNTSQIRFLMRDETAIVDITSERGIDKATLRRTRDDWPKAIRVRLHLSGLESFRVVGEGTIVEWSVSGAAGDARGNSLRQGDKETLIDRTSPYFTRVHIVGGNGGIPLKGGYFEVPLPAKLFEDSPEEITLQWIDFFRN
jgi:hypothetical protein